MNSPLAIISLLLWVLLTFLAIRQYRWWVKSERSEKSTYQNHPAIPTKEYKLSEFVMHDEVEEKPKLILAKKHMKLKLNSEKQIGRLASLKHGWDV